jgi:hypothetical protein
MRTVNGVATYEAMGWIYNRKTIALLLPATLINLATLVLFLVTSTGDRAPQSTDFTDPRTLLLARPRVFRDGKNVRISFTNTFDSQRFVIDILSHNDVTTHQVFPCRFRTSLIGHNGYVMRARSSTEQISVEEVTEDLDVRDYWESGGWGAGMDPTNLMFQAPLLKKPSSRE